MDLIADHNWYSQSIGDVSLMLSITIGVDVSCCVRLHKLVIVFIVERDCNKLTLDSDWVFEELKFDRLSKEEDDDDGDDGDDEEVYAPLMSNLLLLLGLGLVIKAEAGVARFVLETFVNNDECWLGLTAFGFNLLFNTEVVVLLRLSELPLLPWLPLLFTNDNLLSKIPEFVLPDVEEAEDVEEEDGRFLGLFVEGVAAIWGTGVLTTATLIDGVEATCGLGTAKCCCVWLALGPKPPGDKVEFDSALILGAGVVMPPKERAEVLVVAVVLVNPKESMLGGWSLGLFNLKLMVIDEMIEDQIDD